MGVLRSDLMKFSRRRFVGALAKILVGTMCLALVSGVTYEQIERARDRRLFPQLGRSYDIGGRSLNLSCAGEGGPTVVLESPGNDPGYVWIAVQRQIANFAQVCSWDRAGAGWSDPGPFPRTCQANARDLHDLLRAAGVAPPYVLVGYSFGGHDARVYNGLYPGDVAGMVLVDASHEEESGRIRAWGRGKQAPRWLRYPIYLAVKTFAEAGVLRLLQPRLPPLTMPRWTREQAEILLDLRHRPDAIVAGMSSGLFSDENDREAHASGGLGDKPLLVLTAGLPQPVPPKFAAEAAACQEIWKHELQPKLAHLSTRGRQVIVENATHRMGLDMPDVVVAAIRQVEEEVRRSRTR